MNAYQNTYAADFNGMTIEEYNFLNQASAGLNENQMQTFMLVYNNRRKNAQDILLATLLGLLGFAGVQRFMTGRIFLGLVYFFTGGLFMIGTIVDIINYKNIANDYNRQIAYESYEIAKMSS